MSTTIMTTPEHKMAAAGNLLAGIVHELNNPLTTILGFSELLLREGRTGDGRLQKIHSEAERSVRIIQNVLGLARAGGNGRELTDVNDAILRTADLARHQLRLHKVELVLDLAPRRPKVLSQPGELVQVLLNLVTNAVQAIARVQASGKIDIASTVVLNRVQIMVSDDGPGIPESDVQRMFEPFFTTKEDGHGLGLNLSRKLIRDAGGDMWLATKKSNGAAFVVDMPVILDGFQTSEHGPDDDGRMLACDRSVLIVDDEDHITELVESILQIYGYRGVAVNDGEQAIELLKKKEYDILICDVHMPGTDGREVVEWVRSNRSGTHILLLSGDVVGRDTAQFVKACGAHFLPKPFTVGELTKAVQKLFS